MTDRTVRVVLEASATGLTAGMAKAESSVRSFADHADKSISKSPVKLFFT